MDENVIFISTANWASQRHFSSQNNSVHTDRFEYSKQSKEMSRGNVKEKKCSGYSHFSLANSSETLWEEQNERCRDSLMEQYLNFVTETLDTTVICRK